MVRSPAQELAFQDWVDRAKAMPVAVVLALMPNQVKRRGLQMVGPCPVCGGKDRFSVNLAKNLWHCRMSKEGGSAIDLAKYYQGCDFLGAVEFITGEPAPTGEKATKINPEILAQRRLDMATQNSLREQEQLNYRSREINKARNIWANAKPLKGSSAEVYLQRRGLEAPPEADLRSTELQKYWHYSEVKKAFMVVHQGSAMIAAIRDAEGHVMGAHITYIDLATKSGKAEIIDPDTGEMCDAKKVRGSQKGGRIHLSGQRGASHLVVGEGVETTLSPYMALLKASRDISDYMFWASVNLGNMGGPATTSIMHPFLKRKDARGVERRVKVAGPIPKYDDTPCLMPPDYARLVTLLMDGDSDGFTTSQVMLRAASRWQTVGRKIRIAKAEANFDFNDMWQAA